MNQFSLVFLKTTNCSGQKVTIDQCLYIPAQTLIGEHAEQVFSPSRFCMDSFREREKDEKAIRNNCILRQTKKVGEQHDQSENNKFYFHDYITKRGIHLLFG